MSEHTLKELAEAIASLKKLGVPSAGLTLIESVTWLAKQRDRAISERDGLQKKWQCAVELAARAEVDRDNALAEVERLRKTTRPKQSRLEIAARIVQGWASCAHAGVTIRPSAALRIADELITAATVKDSLTVQSATTEESSVDQKEVQA